VATLHPEECKKLFTSKAQMLIDQISNPAKNRRSNADWLSLAVV